MKGDFTISGTWWNAPVFLSKENNDVERLRNWMRIDRQLSDEDSLTWGYFGSGPAQLAYSILREMFNKELAEKHYPTLYTLLIGKLSKERGFALTTSQICEILGLGRNGTQVNVRAPLIIIDDIAKGAKTERGGGADWLEKDNGSQSTLYELGSAIKQKVIGWMERKRPGNRG